MTTATLTNAEVFGFYCLGVLGAMLIRWMLWLSRRPEGQKRTLSGWLGYWPRAGAANILAALGAMLASFLWVEGYLPALADWGVGWAVDKSTGLKLPPLPITWTTSIAAGAAVDLFGKTAAGWGLGWARKRHPPAAKP